MRITECGLHECLGELGAALGGRRAERLQLVILEDAQRAQEAAWISGSGRVPGSGSSSGARRWNVLRGNSRLKNVASHFSNWLAAGQHVVGVPRGLGHRYVDDHDQLECLERLADALGVGERVRGVRALDQHRAKALRGDR